MFPPGSESPRGGSTDALWTVLADDRRRLVLAYFASGDDVASLDALAEYVAARTRRPDDRRAVAIRLHHATLPKLDDLRFLEYDARSHTVRYRDHATLARYLSTVADPDAVVRSDR